MREGRYFQIVGLDIYITKGKVWRIGLNLSTSSKVYLRKPITISQAEFTRGATSPAKPRKFADDAQAVYRRITRHRGASALA